MLETFAQPILANWAGVEGWITTRLLRVVIIVGGINALMSLFIVPLIRWGLVIKRQERMAGLGDVYIQR